MITNDKIVWCNYCIRYLSKAKHDIVLSYSDFVQLKQSNTESIYNGFKTSVKKNNLSIH